MPNIRVLNIVGRMDRGGIETLIMNIYRKIDRNLVQFDFLAHYGKENADYNDEIKILGGNIYEMPQIKTTKRTKYYMFFKYRRALIRFFKNHQEFNIIHIHMTNTARILIPIAKKYGNAKVIIAHSHLTRAKYGFNGFVTNLLQKKIETMATDYFACSYNAAKWFYSKKVVDGNKLIVVNNAVDTSKFDYDSEKRSVIRSKLNINDEVIVGHVGRFFHQKNHKFLIEVFEQILKINSKAKLLLVGEGELKNDIEKLTYAKKINNSVMFLGNRGDVNDIMQAFDVFVMPSFFEGLPVVGIEAQSSGLKCVFSDTITEEVKITENVVFLSLNLDKALWAKKILDISTYKRCSQKELLTIKGFNIDSVAKKLQDYYIARNND